VVLDGYVNDFGRTVHCGDPDAELRRIHDLVMAAQANGMAAMKAGQITAEGANVAARRVIEEAGYGPNFFHRLGHGIGIDVHEPPFLANGDKSVLQANMCFTVEPSIWVEGRCFTRVEDVVVVASEGAFSLNQTTREILARLPSATPASNRRSAPSVERRSVDWSPVIVPSVINAP
jgi:Xaa-Pro aminopeptidase